MKLTIGMAVYDDFDGAFYSIQALRMYHDLTDCEILVVDNQPNKKLETWCRGWGGGVVRYEKYTEVQGTAAPRQKVFEMAKGEFVICIDSHVMLAKGALDRLWNGPDLIHGPMAYDSLNSTVVSMENIWRDNMWGVWSEQSPIDKLPKEPFEIWGHGLGLFGCRKDSWLGFNPGFRQFGGEEGYIHEKYRKAGRKVLCLPWMIWNHKFFNLRDNPTTYKRSDIARVRNYIIGFNELGMDTQPIKDHFGINIFNAAKGNL